MEVKEKTNLKGGALLFYFKYITKFFNAYNIYTWYILCMTYTCKGVRQDTIGIISDPINLYQQIQHLSDSHSTTRKKRYPYLYIYNNIYSGIDYRNIVL